MDTTANILNSLVSITQFNKGQSARIFDRLKTERRLIVLKNNVPSAVILSPEEYTHLIEAAENVEFLSLAQARTKNYMVGTGFSNEKAMAKLSLSEDDLSNADDLELE